ncbi:CRTAC1 family protein [Flexithrix dorotheae]|uniref:CRTAC1 family protein n=1 Tax=Flexithrix dorotheae TaxID=70993 RepID=UPI00146E1F1B|nr:CRTAC1 family protein [Flexithrix dorotheae]
MRYCLSMNLFRFFPFIVLVLIGCQNPKQENLNPDMKALLKQMGKEASTWRNPYMQELSIAHYDSMMASSEKLEDKLKYQYFKGLGLLNAGQSNEAAKLFENLRKELLENKQVFPGNVWEIIEKIDSYTGISYMRIGEQENCIHHHNVASCIIPIEGSGIHHKQNGSKEAIKIYTNILNQNPGSLDAIWLLNIAYMTIGEYPESVPEKWLIPFEKFESDYPLKHFTDIAGKAGVDAKGLSGGSVMEDFNGDGFLDIMVTSWGVSDQMQYFQNNGDNTFSEKTQEAGLTGIVGGLNMVHADYDNDGNADVFVLRGAWLDEHGRHPNSLLKNTGTNAEGIPLFKDVTIEAGILSFFPTQTASWADFNNDGWLDIFIGNESSSKLQNHFSELFINNQDGTFKEVAKISGVNIQEFVKGVTTGDYNNDGWMDIYISTLESPNLLFRNNGETPNEIPTFTEVSKETGLAENISTFPTWFWDYNNDGWLDIFVSGYNWKGSRPMAYNIAAEHLDIPFKANMPRLYLNNGENKDGKVSFTDVTREAGLYKILFSMGCNYGDLENDGYLDMYLGTGDPDLRSILPNKMYRNDKGIKFQDVTTAGGFGNIQKGHGVSFADFDNDGDQDIYIVMGGAYSGDIYQNLLFENPYSQNESSNNWINIHLEGMESNKQAVGSRVKIIIEEEGKNREIHREVNSGASFGCSPMRLEVGLGKATIIKSLKIFWHGSGNVQEFKNVDVNQFIKIIEGQANIMVKKPVFQ